METHMDRKRMLSAEGCMSGCPLHVACCTLHVSRCTLPSAQATHGPRASAQAGYAHVQAATYWIAVYCSSRRCHICTRTGLTPATSAPGLGSPLPHLHRGCAFPHLHRDSAGATQCGVDATGAAGVGAAVRGGHAARAPEWERVLPAARSALRRAAARREAEVPRLPARQVGRVASPLLRDIPSGAVSRAVRYCL